MMKRNSTSTSTANNGSTVSTGSTHQIHQLQAKLNALNQTTTAAITTCQSLSRRSQHLDSLTTPASETSSSLTLAASNISSILSLMKDAKEKLDTVVDCEPAMTRLYQGAKECLEIRQMQEKDTFGIPNVHTEEKSHVDDDQTVLTLGTLTATGQSGSGGGHRRTTSSSIQLTEQDVYAAADSMEIIRDAYHYFETPGRKNWKATPTLLLQLERVHELGVNGMCNLLSHHFLTAGPAVRLRRAVRTTATSHVHKDDDASTVMTRGESTIVTTATIAAAFHSYAAKETAADTRARLSTALQRRDLMKSVGEYEEYWPLDTRQVRELRSMLECLGAVLSNDGYGSLNGIGGGLLSSPGVTSSHSSSMGMDGSKDGASGTTTIYQQGCFLNPQDQRRRIKKGMEALKKHHLMSGKVTRTETIGSGGYSNLVKKKAYTGYPHLDAYAEARKTIAFQSIDTYCKILQAERFKYFSSSRGITTDEEDANGGDSGAAGNSGTGMDDAPNTPFRFTDWKEMDASARDAVRCLEHAMVIVAGEKSIYRTIVSPTSSHTHDTSKIPMEYKNALVASYSHVVSAVVDRVMDIIESFFVRDVSLRQMPSNSESEGDGGNTSEKMDESNASSPSTLTMSVRVATIAATSSLRILDGVRMLGPSLARLCEIASSKHDSRSNASGSATEGTKGDDGKNAHQSPPPIPTASLAANLCIAIHRTTVKSCAKTLENLAFVVKSDPLEGEKYRPSDARVAAVSSDVVRAVRLVAPFVNAYKSVSKRRSLPWDVKVGDAAGEIEFFIRHLVMTLLSNLQTKALNYTKDPSILAQARSYLFMMNNTFYLIEQLGAKTNEEYGGGGEYKIDSPWFADQVRSLFENSKRKYLQYWNVLNEHLKAVPKVDLIYNNKEQKVLTLESGRLLKSKFSNFNEAFENTYEVHAQLTVIDPTLRAKLIEDVQNVFFPKYEKFYGEYSKIQFSKKNQDEYLKYPPQRIHTMMGAMFSSS